MRMKSALLIGAFAAAAPVIAQDRAASPNGGRPEIHSVEEMRRLGNYTAPGARAYADLAAEAGGRLWPVTLYYRCQAIRERRPLQAPAPTPVEVFDHVYSIGTAENNIWAIDTNQGIILLDALSTSDDARDVIVANMKTLKLDPKRIRIIVVTHNHFDHFGGAAYLKALSGAKIGMSHADWQGKPTRGTLPVKTDGDFYIEDGQQISLGDRTMTALLTPGHTPGTISLLFPVTDHGVPHMASLFGGQGSPRDVTALMQFRHSLDHFADYTDRMQADVVLSNHTVGDDGLTRIAALQRRRAGEANPYVVGREGVIRYDAEWRDCLSADIDQAVVAGQQPLVVVKVKPPQSVR